MAEFAEWRNLETSNDQSSTRQTDFLANKDSLVKTR